MKCSVVFIVIYVFFCHAGCDKVKSKSNINSKVVQSFNTEIRPIVQKSCSQCHRSFVKFDVFYDEASEIKYMLHKRKMPPKSVTGFSEHDRKKIIDWISANK